MARATVAMTLFISPAAFADWLVIDSSSARFPSYLLLDENAVIKLAAGERLQLLDDSGTTHELRGPTRVRLGELAIGSDASDVTQSGLVGRLASLMSDPGKAETPGASRSTIAGGTITPAPLIPGGWPKPAATDSADTLHMAASGNRCVETLDGQVLERNAAEANVSARVEIRLPGSNQPLLMTWLAGFTTLQLDGVGAMPTPDGVAVIRVAPSTGPARELRVTLVQRGGALDKRLGLMADAGCRDDVARVLKDLATR